MVSRVTDDQVIRTHVGAWANDPANMVRSGGTGWCSWRRQCHPTYQNI
jgi:hypothetical protein